uniref:Involucrin repeat protein n=1 Tax=Colletotrichum fructicola (strain Nara gc5) TaxID=1213859 RepID=L2GH53_COLFN
MTKDKKLLRMSDKRRPGGSVSSGGSNTGSGSSNNTTGGSTAGSKGGSNTHSLHTTSSRSPGSGNAASIIAPPPRAHHAPTSSAVPDEGSSSRESGKDAKDKESRSTKDTPSTGTAANTSSGSSSSSSTTLLKDKDARIAKLERELEIMEQEFTRELDKLSQAESETAFLRADADLRILRQEAEHRDADRDASRREVGELRAQVRGLKEFVSTSTRTNGQTSDEVFCEGMMRLGNGLQNWIIVHFRRAKLDVAAASEDVRDELGRLVPMYADLETSAKVHMLQSIVSRILMDVIFENCFFGLPKEQADKFRAMEETLSSYVDDAEAVNNWRSSTLALFQREAETKMQAETAASTDAVIARVNGILDAVTDAKATEARDTPLRTLVGSAVDLSRQLAVQKAVFRIHMPDIVPDQETKFDPATMEDIGGEDEEALSGRNISCVTFPGVIKRGDENGGHMQYQNIIAKARVLCSPE